MKYDKQQIGKTIRKLRLSMGKSQEIVSSFAGIARSHLSMIENGDKQPSLETIWKIAAALGVTASYILKLIEQNSDKDSEDK